MGKLTTKKLYKKFTLLERLKNHLPRHLIDHSIMRVSSIALQAVILAASVVGSFAASSSRGTGTGSAGLAIAAAAAAAVLGVAADARVSRENVETGFVSDGSKHTYHEKLVLFTRYFRQQTN